MFTNVSKIKLYIETKNYNKNMSVLPELQNYELYQAFLKIFEILIQLT